jgi:uncharacterized protein YcfL
MMFNLKHTLLCTAMSLPLALTGCMSSDAPATVKVDKYAPQQVAFANQDLANSIAIGKIDRTFDSSQIMHLSIPLRATTDLGLGVDYRITYFDENHTPVDSPTAWQTKSLTPGIGDYIQATSASPRAKDFQIDFRWAAQ